MPNNPQVVAFATALDRGDHAAALDILVDLSRTGRRDQAVDLLRTLDDLARVGHRATVASNL